MPIDASIIPDRILYGNEAWDALKRFSNVVAGQIYTTYWGRGATLDQEFPVDIPSGRIRLFELDDENVGSAAKVPAHTNILQPGQLPANYQAMLVRAITIQLMVEPSIEIGTDKLVAEALHLFAQNVGAEFNINDQVVQRFPGVNFSTAFSLSGMVIADAAAIAASVYYANANEGMPARVPYWELDESIFIPRTMKMFFVDLIFYMPGFGELLLGELNWWIKCTLWGKAALQIGG